MEKFLFLLLIIIFTTATFAKDDQEKIYKVRLGASTKEQRSLIANLMPIDKVNTDSVESIINASDLKALQKQIPYMLLQASEVSSSSSWFDFPSTHADYHNYENTLKKIDSLTELHPLIAQKIEIGLSHEGRSIRGLRISASASNKSETPAFLLMGLHHAREHLSVEVALLFAEYLVNNYSSDDRVRELLNNRVVYIIPIINPDGETYDLKDNSFNYWRKNRRASADQKTFGVDLNRNYGYKWGTGGSSSNPASDVYKGPSAFSEPETKAVKSFIESHSEIKMILTLHSYSELILYPWGHQYEGVGGRDQQVFETMANQMAKWNHYKPQQSSDLYQTSGDTCDWAWGERKIFCFTFELSPKDSDYYSGGFYPPSNFIKPTFEANLPAILYMLNVSANPYSVLN